MSATMHLSAHSWASAHRALLTVATFALALAVALTVTFVVTRTTAERTVAPGSGVSQYDQHRDTELQPGSRNSTRLGPLAR